MARGPDGGVRFQVLGPVTVQAPGGWQGELPPQRRQVLALLLTQRGQRLTTSQIVERIWPSSPPRTAAQMVRDHVRGLRALFGEAAEELISGGRAGYQISVANRDIDAVRFVELVREGRHQLAAGEATAAVHTLAYSISLWQGPQAFADVRELACLEAEAQMLDELRVRTEELLAQAHLTAGQPHSAVPLLRRLTILHPTRECPWLLLLAALTAASRRAEAAEAYRQAHEHLVEKTGLDPSPTLRAVHQAVLCGASSSEILAAATHCA